MLIEPGSVSCLVKGCDEPAFALWESIYFVCSFHHHALVEGEPWGVEESSEHPAPILMGTDLPPIVMGVQAYQRQNSAMIVSFVTGRDGVREGTVDVRMDIEYARTLVGLLEYLERHPNTPGE